MAIIPIVASQAPLSFLLCFRALSAEDSGHVVGTSAVKVATACMVGVLHCPWCGTDLRRFYSNRVDKLPVVDIGNEVLTGSEQVFAQVDKGEDVIQCGEEGKG